jgi:ketosteroid isomerase-like protein
MSQENLHALRRLYQGWAAGDVGAEATIWDPYVVYVSQAADSDPGPHYGLEAMTAYYMRFLESWGDWRLEALDYGEAGDSFVVKIHRSATGKRSGVPVDDHAFHVCTFRAGRLIRLEVLPRT